MRKTLILLLLCLLSFALHTQDRCVTIHRKGVTIATILSDIERQTDYLFIYGQDVNVKARVTVNVKNTTVREVLHKILAGNQIGYEMSGEHIILKRQSEKQVPKPRRQEWQVPVNNKRTVTGHVIDDTGEPLAGVSVVIKGSGSGSITDLDGNYAVLVDNDDDLEFSYLGYITKNEHVGGKTRINVALNENPQVLTDVVVIGYGVQNKNDVTGAISSLKDKDIENRTIANVDQAMQGKVAGVQVITPSGSPGTPSTVRIRGYSSNGSSDPLYIVDGLRADYIINLDPNDIESMEILKDAASAAIYGAEAGNGVVLVTTKHAKPGKSTVTYDMQLTSQSLGHKPKMMNAKEYVDYMTEGGFINQSQLDQYYDGKTDIAWLNRMFENTLMQHHNVSFSSGSDKSSLYLSMGYYGNNGIFVGNKDKYDRITGMLNAKFDITDWLSIGTNNQFARFHINQIMEDVANANSVIVYTIMASPIWEFEKGRYSVNPYGTLQNPEAYNDIYTNKLDGTHFGGTTYVSIKPFKGFNFTSRLGYIFSYNNQYYSSTPFQLTADREQRYWVVNAESGNRTYYQWENFANYKANIGGKQHIDGMAGMSFSDNKNNGINGGINGNNNGDLGIISNNPNYAYFNYSTTSATRALYGGEPTHTSKLSYFGRLSYDYAEKYFLQLSLRADAADLSRLPRKHRWGYFPAISAGWQVINEKFMERQKVFDYLKLRASWGRNGSLASLGNYSYASVIGSSGFYSFNDNYDPEYTTALQPTTTGNNDLRRERSDQFDVGVDMRFLKGRLGVAADYYIKKTKDLIISNYTPSYMVGVTASPVNAGNVDNKGFELEVTWKDSYKDFSYGIHANIATLNNKVTYLTNDAGKRQGTYNSFEEGYPMWYMRGYDYIGTAPTTGYYLNGKQVESGTSNAIMYQAGYPMYRDVDGNGFIGDNDLTKIGCGIPDFTYGITLAASYKNFDFLIFEMGSHGNDIFYSNNIATITVANKWREFYDKRWMKDGDNTRYPRPSMQNDDQFNHSSSFVYGGSYFKIKQIQLGYSLPKSLVRHFAMSKLCIYVSLDDFFTITHYPGFDPETVTGGTTIGTDYGVYPTSKKVVFGLNVTF